MAAKVPTDTFAINISRIALLPPNLRLRPINPDWVPSDGFFDRKLSQVKVSVINDQDRRDYPDLTAHRDYWLCDGYNRHCFISKRYNIYGDMILDARLSETDSVFLRFVEMMNCNEATSTFQPVS